MVFVIREGGFPFPFPSPTPSRSLPDEQALRKRIKCVAYLGFQSVKDMLKHSDGLFGFLGDWVVFNDLTPSPLQNPNHLLVTSRMTTHRIFSAHLAAELIGVNSLRYQKV